MIGRAVAEWVGSSPDAAIPKHVKLRIWGRCGGRCAMSGRKIMPGDAFAFDHIRALCNGGENREFNIQLLLTSKHKEKTANDVKERAKVDRLRSKHTGIDRQSRRPWNPGLKKKVNGRVERIT